MAAQSTVEVAIKNCCTTIGEGPHWDEKSQTLLFVDILKNEIHKYSFQTGKDEKIHLAASVGFVVPRTAGGCVAGVGRTFSVIEWDSQQTEVIHEVDHGTKNRLNDGKCDPSGRLWAGTMGYETVPAQPERKMGSLYSMDADRKLRKHLSEIDISNGLAWSSDNKIMYYIDSVPRKVYAFDFDINNGDIKNQRVVVDFGGEETIPDLGFPDGMCIDQDDKVWVACYNVGKVIRFDPSTGAQMQTIKVPAQRSTSCCFGGKNLDELYVTTSREGAPEEELQAQPLAGSIFRVTGLGTKGLPVPGYCG